MHLCFKSNGKKRRSWMVEFVVQDTVLSLLVAEKASLEALYKVRIEISGSNMVRLSGAGDLLKVKQQIQSLLEVVIIDFSLIIFLSTLLATGVLDLFDEQNDLLLSLSHSLN